MEWFCIESEREWSSLFASNGLLLFSGLDSDGNHSFVFLQRRQWFLRGLNRENTIGGEIGHHFRDFTAFGKCVTTSELPLNPSVFIHLLVVFATNQKTMANCPNSDIFGFKMTAIEFH